MPIKLPSFRARRDVYPADLWTKCPSCEEMLFNKQLDKALRVCPTCGHHFRLSAAARLDLLLDHGTWAERDAGLQLVDPLGFVDQKPYPDRLLAAQTATGMRDAAVWGTAHRLHPGRASASWTSGSWADRWAPWSARRSPAPRNTRSRRASRSIVVSASGGARMQEGTLALMQLAKTSRPSNGSRSAACRSSAILSDPTTGGVFASFAAVGDVNVAEPNALIGFAGSRVAAGHDRAGAAGGLPALRVPVRHGFIDRVVARARAPRRGRPPAATRCPVRRRRDAAPVAQRRTERGRSPGGAGRCPSSRRSPAASARPGSMTARRAGGPLAPRPSNGDGRA